MPGPVASPLGTAASVALAVALALLGVALAPAAAVAAPAPVTGLTAQPGDRAVRLGWTPPAAGVAVEVRRATGPTAPVRPTDGTPVPGATAGGVVDTGLVNGTTYSYAVFSRSGTEHGDPATVTATPALPPATALVLTPSPRTQAGGRAVALYATLTTSGAAPRALGGEAVEYWRIEPGQLAWTRVGSRGTDARGVARLDVAPTRRTWYLARFLGSPWGAASSSPTAVVTVVPLVSLSAAAGVVAGATVTLSGRVVPAYPGGQVRLERYVGGAWRLSSTLTQTATGTFAVGKAHSAAGYWSWRAVVPATGEHAAGTSATRTVDAYRLHRYLVTTRGTIRTSVADFAAAAAAIYADPRGYPRAHRRFVRVTSGASDFTVVLSEARYLPTYDPICSPMYSCRAGRYVVINQDRWLGGSPYFLGPLYLYRQMVLNHETGHWLGMGHAYCGGAGQLAPVMQQQSKGMQGCRPNAWPLAWEIARVVAR